MKTGSFSYEVRARCAPDQAARVLTNLAGHAGLNPLIVSVESVAPRHGGRRAYLIHDRLRWGPVTFPMTYRAEVLAESEREVVMLAVQQLRTTVRTVARIEPDAGGVLIRVTFTMTAPRLLFGYAMRQGHAAHLELAKRLPAVMAAQTAD